MRFQPLLHATEKPVDETASTCHAVAATCVRGRVLLSLEVRQNTAARTGVRQRQDACNRVKHFLEIFNGRFEKLDICRISASHSR